MTCIQAGVSRSLREHGAPGQKALLSKNEFTLLWIFAKSLYPQPVPLTFQPQICKDGFISIVFDISPECCLFDRVRADNLVVRKKDDRNKKTSHLILKVSMNEAFIWLSGHRFIDREIFNG